jgi:hypothetical protein
MKRNCIVTIMAAASLKFKPKTSVGVVPIAILS